MILAYSLLFLSILTEVFYIRTFHKLKKRKEDKENHERIVTHSKTNTLLTPIASLLFWFLGIFFLSKPDMEAVGYLCFCVYASHLFMPYSFLSNIIIYNEQGFQTGYPPCKIYYYHYDDVTEIITNKRRWDIIYVGEKELHSSNHTPKEFEEFINYIQKHRSQNEQSKEQTTTKKEKNDAAQLYTAQPSTIECSPKEMTLPIHFYAGNDAFIMMMGIVLLFLGIPLLGFVIFTCFPALSFCAADLFLEITLLTISRVISRVIFALLLSTIGIALVSMGWMLISLGKREILFEQTGLRIKYPLEKWRQLPWSAFGKICICYEPDLTPQRNYITAEDTKLCFLRVGENSFWRPHNLFHYRKIFMLPYTEEFLTLVKETCPIQIVDKRDSRVYKSMFKSNLH